MHMTSPSIPRTLTTAACMMLVACASNITPAVSTAPSGISPSIGWLHGSCIALADPDVAVGTGVVLVSLDGPRQKATTARIEGAADGSDSCPALLEDRRDANRTNGLSFYWVDPVPAAELAIGVVTAQPSPIDADAVLDTNADGQRDTFHQCATAEGMQFSVWADDVGNGEPLWRGYYYLGYDVQPDCIKDNSAGADNPA